MKRLSCVYKIFLIRRGDLAGGEIFWHVFRIVKRRNRWPGWDLTNSLVPDRLIEHVYIHAVGSVQVADGECPEKVVWTVDVFSYVESNWEVHVQPGPCACSATHSEGKQGLIQGSWSQLIQSSPHLASTCMPVALELVIALCSKIRQKNGNT